MSKDEIRNFVEQFTQHVNFHDNWPDIEIDFTEDDLPWNDLTTWMNSKLWRDSILPSISPLFLPTSKGIDSPEIKAARELREKGISQKEATYIICSKYYAFVLRQLFYHLQVKKFDKRFVMFFTTWLRNEILSLSHGCSSPLIKLPVEAANTASTGILIYFTSLQEEWVKHEKNPKYIFQAISYAAENRVALPDWVNTALLSAGNTVYSTQGKTTFGKALGITKGKFSKGVKQEIIASIIAEAVDAKFSIYDAIELTMYEIDFCPELHSNNKQPYSPGTLENYYQNFVIDREGFSIIYTRFLKLFGHENDDIFQSRHHKKWRSQTLQTRFEAYQYTSNNGFVEKLEIIDYVTASTVNALRKYMPPKNPLGLF